MSRINKNPPRTTSGGKRKAVSSRQCLIKTAGTAAKGFQRKMSSHSEPGGVLPGLWPLSSGAVGNASRCENDYPPSFEVREHGPGADRSLRRQEHLVIQPEVAGVSFDSSIEPSILKTGGRAVRHCPFRPGDLPFSSPPRRAAVSRCPPGPVRPLTGTLPRSL